ncbi:alpha/beta fold hydrolase [Hoyosella sp. G463]|uniref:Alpha/beta fold hydrolase n=1 Tax=Lolliginicoccus lacisalsi TaxID=2742202 RepID=A0A927PML3_9ACTN|nr:alpha/beta fold hydrolase [Lolliginicoccus lacisalsi]MBD8506722.1 alpha/beta fold hydrolase [Lolliginicoccus lacisalsi]
MSDLSVESWGAGDPVILVHGALATGAEEWQAQEPLAREGYQLLVPDRRGYGNSPEAKGEDFLRDADDIADLIGDGAHLVAHSYGGLGAMLAAARRPGSVRSLALLEPPAFTMITHPDAARLVERVRGIWDEDLSDREWLRRFFEAVGTDPASLPPEVLENLAPMVPIARRSRPAWTFETPINELAAARFPKLVVSGAHSPGFDAICDELAEQIHATRAEVAGAGHEIQFTGDPINHLLLDLWHGGAGAR